MWLHGHHAPHQDTTTATSLLPMRISRMSITVNVNHGRSSCHSHRADGVHCALAALADRDTLSESNRIVGELPRGPRATSRRPAGLTRATSESLTCDTLNTDSCLRPAVACNEACGNLPEAAVKACNCGCMSRG
jgi:hypothetical protein